MSHQPVAILLNPPSREIAIRDNYCSKISQAAYINHPIDLLFQSGYLCEIFNVQLIDAIVDKMTVTACLEKVIQNNPSIVFSLAGNATWPEDLLFFQAIRQNLPDVKLVCTGDIFLESPVTLLNQHPEIDAILTDYTSDGLKKYAREEFDLCPDLVFRDKTGVIRDHRQSRQQSGIITAPLPCHELFLNHDYRYPFVKHHRFATVMTEFGCPFHCSFCVMGTLGCKRRPIQIVIEELKYLAKYKVHDVFFLDQSFGSDPDRNMELCRIIQNSFSSLRWLCFSRVDLVNENILRSMKNAGCHTIIFGVETANEVLLKKYRKGYSTADVSRVLTLARKIGIRTVATFLLGLPGETWESAMNTIQFAESLPCTYASINVAVPRMGTEMRRDALERGFIDPSVKHFDQSGTSVIMNTDTLTRDQLQKLKRIAIRRLYLNPRRLLRMLSSIQTLDELLIQIREGSQLAKRFFGKKQ